MSKKHRSRFLLLLLFLCAAVMLGISSCYATHAQSVRRAERMLVHLVDGAEYEGKKAELLALVIEGFGEEDAFPVRERAGNYFKERFGWGDLLYCDVSEALLADVDFISLMGQQYDSGYIVFLYRRGFAQPDSFQVKLKKEGNGMEKGREDVFVFRYADAE